MPKTNIPNQRLKAVLAGLGWSHAALAKNTGYAEQTIRNVASGVSESARARQKIENALGVRIWPRPGDQAPGATDNPSNLVFPDRLFWIEAAGVITRRRNAEDQK